MLDFVISRILEQFIPTHLAIVIEPPRGDVLTQYCYVNLKPSEEQAPGRKLRAAPKEHFLNSPYPVRYADLAGGLGPRRGLARFDPELLYPDVRHRRGLRDRRPRPQDRRDRPTPRSSGCTSTSSCASSRSASRTASTTRAPSPTPRPASYNHAYFTQRLEQEIAHVRAARGQGRPHHARRRPLQDIQRHLWATSPATRSSTPSP